MSLYESSNKPDQLRCRFMATLAGRRERAHSIALEGARLQLVVIAIVNAFVWFGHDSETERVAGPYWLPMSSSPIAMHHAALR